MSKTTTKVLTVILALCLTTALAACGGDAQSAAQSTPVIADASGPDSGAAPPDAPAGTDAGIMGMLSSVDGDTLVIELMETQGMAMPQDGDPPEGMSLPQDGSMPGGGRGGDGQALEGMTPPNGASFPGDGSLPEGGGPGGEGGQRGGGGFQTTGETLEVTVTGDTAVTLMGGEALTLADLETGDMLQITLAEDGVTAVSISVMRMDMDGAPAAGQGE